MNAPRSNRVADLLSARAKGSAPEPKRKPQREPKASAMNALLRLVAEFALALGWALTPLRGKRPVLGRWQERVPATADEIEEWIEEGYNLGVRTGTVSGVVVLDDDTGTQAGAKHFDLPPTVTVETSPGKRHYYYRLPEGVVIGNSVGKLFSMPCPSGPLDKRGRPKVVGLDVRAEHGQAVLAYSIHPDTGEPYRFLDGHGLDEIEVAELPANVLEAIRTKEERTKRDGPAISSAEALEALDTLDTSQRERLARYAAGTLESIVEGVRSLVEGERNDGVNGSGYRIGRFIGAGLLNYDDARAALREAAEETELPDDEIDRTLDRALSDGEADALDPVALVARLEKSNEWTLGNLSKHSKRSDAQVEEEAFRERRDSILALLYDVLPEAVEQRKPERILSLRAELGWLKRNDAASLREFRNALKEHKADLAYPLGDFDAFLKEAEQEDIRRERSEQLERLREEDPRPLIHASADPKDRDAQALDALVLWNEAQDPPALYSRCNSLVRVFPGREARAVRADEFGPLLADSTRFFKHDQETGIRIVDPPQRTIRNLVGSPVAYRFPELALVSTSPILTPSGQVVSGGYDAETRKLILTDPDLSLDIPDEPTIDDLRCAVRFVEENVFGAGARSAFPFITEADHANAWALFLTMVCRDAIVGLVPMAVVDAPTPSTGKSMLCKASTLIAAGADDTAELPTDDRKLKSEVLDPALNENRRFLIFDNFPKGYTLQSRALASLLTDRTYTFREFFTQGNVTVPNNLVLVVNGNNIKYERDYVRRTYRIALDAKCANPDARIGFKHADLLGWIEAHRSQLLSALFTIARAWYVAGCPEPTVPVLGSYVPWTRVIGGMLEHAGIPGFLRNRDQSAATDTRTEEFEGFLRAVLTTGVNPEAFTVSSLFANNGLRPEDLLPSFYRERDLSSTETKRLRLGRILKEQEGQRFGGECDEVWVSRCIDDRGRPLHDSRTRVALWRLNRVTFGAEE